MKTSPKILIVESERIIAMDINSILRSNGYTRNTLAYSTDEALRKIEETTPDIVFMDTMINNDSDGLRTGRKINEQYRIPVIYLSTMPNGAPSNNCAANESLQFIHKPFSEEEISLSVAHIMKTKNRRRKK